MKRWQLTPDQQSAISGVINGMSAEARQLVRQHLEFKKYDESGYCVLDCVIFLFVFHISGIKCCDPDAPCWCPNNTLNWGYNESLLRSKRHQLHEVPKGIPPSWIDRLTASLTSINWLLFVFSLWPIQVALRPSPSYDWFIRAGIKTNPNIYSEVTHDSQTLHFKRYNQWWASNAKRVKKSARARLRWGEEQWGKSVDQCCLVVWAIRERSKNPKVAQQTSLNNIHFVVLLRDVVNVCVLFVPLASKGHFRHAWRHGWCLLVRESLRKLS